MEKSFMFDVVSKLYLATDSNPVDAHSFELCSDMLDVVIDVSCIYGCARACALHRATARAPTLARSEVRTPELHLLTALCCCAHTRTHTRSLQDHSDALAFDDQSGSVIRLTGGPYNGMILYLRQISRCVARSLAQRRAAPRRV